MRRMRVDGKRAWSSMEFAQLIDTIDDKTCTDWELLAA
jgi:hypothetical protein